MVVTVRSLGLNGVSGYEVSAECFLSGGLPAFDIVGLPDAAVREARERVRAAVKNCGAKFPVSRITVNLAPAGQKKAGTLYDLPIFVGLLAAAGVFTVLAAVGQGARGIPLGPRGLFTAAGVTTAVTFLSLELGALGASFLPAGLAEKLGGLALAGLGLWYLLDALRGKNDPPQEATRGWLALSAALAVNNAGVGVAAGVTGLSPLVASGCNFAVTVLALLLTAGWNGTAYYPSLTDPQSSLTIRNSSSSLFTLQVMSWVSLLIPFVVAYIWYAWRSLARKEPAEGAAAEKEGY